MPLRHYRVVISPPFICANGAAVEHYDISCDHDPAYAAKAADSVWGPVSLAVAVLEYDSVFHHDDDMPDAVHHLCTGKRCADHSPLATGYGTCEACGAVCTTVHLAYDEIMREHYFCMDCRDSGAGIRHLENLAG